MKKLICSLLIIFSTCLIGAEIEYTKLVKPNIKLLPTSVTVSDTGEVYVVDSFLGAIVKYSNKWRYKYTLQVKSIKSIVDIFYYEGYVYVLSGEGKIFRFDENGKIDYYKEYEKGKLLGQLSNPNSLFIKDGKIYISDTGNSRIQIFNLDGSIEGAFGYKTYTISGFIHNTGISIAGDNMLVADSGTKEVKIYDKDGFYVTNLKDPQGKAFIFESPEEIFVDERNSIFVVDSGTNQIFTYFTDGTLKKIGKKGNKKTEFYGIKDVWVDTKYIYIVDTLNQKIKIFDKNTYELKKVIGASNLMKIITFAIVIIVLIVLFMTLVRMKKKGSSNIE